MTAQTAPMGWNSWNTFGPDISEQLIFEMADAMADEGYLDAGYEYLVIDDCWALRERGEDGSLVPDPEKFPHGMKAVADYVHSRGLKFGIYSCAGILTCAGYPSSYDHEFEDARLFASWGVDFLKYDFCNFPEYANCKNRYLTMGMALRASGRDILYSACNWGSENCWDWMRSVGAHMYRSTGDIFDNYASFTGIFKSQLEHLSQSGPYCFNDMDMLTVGMYNKGNVAIGRPCTDNEYRMEFAMWCLAGAPLMLGADLRSLPPQIETLLKNPELIAIDQDPECRPPYQLSCRAVLTFDENPDTEQPMQFEKNQLYIFIKLLKNNEFALAYFNLHEDPHEMLCIFAEAGIPYSSGYGFELTDAFSGECLGPVRDYHRVMVEGHSCKMYRCRLVKMEDLV